jgi:uncharacterized protein
MTHFEQLRQKRAAILVIADKYGATNLRIFGSVARGDDRPDSDIDILIDQENVWSLFDHVAMMQDLEDLLQRKVDLATANAFRPGFKDRILQDAIAL